MTKLSIVWQLLTNDKSMKLHPASQLLSRATCPACSGKFGVLLGRFCVCSPAFSKEWIEQFIHFLQTWRGSFSAVSTATIARLGSFCSIFGELQDLQSFAPLRSQNFRKKSPDFFAKMKLSFSFSFSFLQNSMNFVIFLLNFDEFLSEFHETLQEIAKI